MSKRDRGSKGGNNALFAEELAPGGGQHSAAGAWQPGARIAVFVMLGVLCGADIWIFTAAKITSLPQVQVHVYPSQLGQSISDRRSG